MAGALLAAALVVPPGSFAASDAEVALSQSLAVELALLRPSSPPLPVRWRNACGSSATDLCYDTVDRRIVYRPARDYMPAFEGLTAESISLRRSGIHFKYSFR